MSEFWEFFLRLSNIIVGVIFVLIGGEDLIAKFADCKTVFESQKVIRKLLLHC